MDNICLTDIMRMGRKIFICVGKIGCRGMIKIGVSLFRSENGGINSRKYIDKFTQIFCKEIVEQHSPCPYILDRVRVAH